MTRRYTVICDFEGGTYIAQVVASDAGDAARAWAGHLVREQPIPAASRAIAEAVERHAEPPVAIDSMIGVWCLSGLADDRPFLANIIQSA